jgi:hypothetical protein
VAGSQLVLGATAEYIEGGDTVLVTAHLFDPDNDSYEPQMVRSGTCSLRYQNATIQAITFDRRFGNSDGSFNFQFSHPSAIRGLSVEFEIVTTTGYTLKTTVPVIKEAEDPSIPLASVPDTDESVVDYRTKKRLQELL